MQRRERRRRRTSNTTRALSYQLEACQSEAGLDGMILSDGDGLCLAASGEADACAEIAARLPLIGRKVSTFDGVLFSHDRRWQVAVRRLEVEGAELYLAAVGGPAEHRTTQLGRSERGVVRILDHARARA